MEYAALTDVGMKRTNNEDSYIINISEESGDKIFVVADGMGGHNAGEIASRDACRIVESQILNQKGGKIEDVLTDAVKKANREIYIRAAENTLMRGMGTTIEALVIKDDMLCLAHVGDSRVYIVSEDAIRKITKDHSIVGMMVDEGTISEEEAKNHPQRNLITRAVGTSITVNVDIVKEPIHSGEWILMCTDGLTNMVSRGEIHGIITNAQSCNDAVRKLIDRAKEHGGDDNITAVLIKIPLHIGRDK